MKISYISDKYYILSSESIILFEKDKDIKINIEMSQDFSFTIHFIFVDKENQNVSFNVKANTETNTITYECYNFNSVLGNGTRKPLEIATFNNKRLFINFMVQKLETDAPRILTYTIYSE